MHWINKSPEEIKISSLIKLAEVTGYPKEWLIFGEDDSEIPGIAEERGEYLVSTISPKEHEIIDRYRLLNQPEQEAIKLVLSSMTGSHP